MKWLAQLTNAFSKKFENDCHALVSYLVFKNFCRVHKTLGARPGTETPNLREPDPERIEGRAVSTATKGRRKVERSSVRSR